MNKNITIFFVGLFLASCSNFELPGIEKKTVRSLDTDDPEYSCLGSKNKTVCLKNMRLIRELEKQNTKIVTELKEQKREIQELKRDLSQQCMNQGGTVVGDDCLNE